MNQNPPDNATAPRSVAQQAYSGFRVRVIRFGRTINKRDRFSVIFGDFDGWIAGRYAIKALRCHQLFMRSRNSRKRSKWSHATERALRQAWRICPNDKLCREAGQKDAR